MNKDELKEDIQVLFDRREELRTEINKMQKEYSALGRVIMKAMNNIKQQNEQETLSRVQKQIDEQTRNGRTDVYIDNKDLGFISGIAMNEGRSVVDAKQLQNMLDEYER